MGSDGQGRRFSGQRACCSSVRTWVWISRSHVKSRYVRWLPVIPALGKQNQEIPGQTSYRWILNSARELASITKVEGDWKRYTCMHTYTCKTCLHITHIHMEKKWGSTGGDLGYRRFMEWPSPKGCSWRRQPVRDSGAHPGHLKPGT